MLAEPARSLHDGSVGVKVGELGQPVLQGRPGVAIIRGVASICLLGHPARIDSFEELGFQIPNFQDFPAQVGLLLLPASVWRETEGGDEVGNVVVVLVKAVMTQMNK